jgi:hypothetical protein
MKGIRATQGRLTGEMTKSQSGKADDVTVAVLAGQVTAIGGDAFSGHSAAPSRRLSL